MQSKRCEKRWSFDVQGSLSACSFCFKNQKHCNYQLSNLNSHWLSLPLASPGRVSTSPAGQGSVSHTAEQQHPIYVPTARQSLFSIADWTTFPPPTVPSSPETHASSQFNFSQPHPLANSLCYTFSSFETLLTQTSCPYHER